MTDSDGVTRELLMRYDVPGPRYTSYPTVPAWKSEFGPDDWRAALRRANERAGAPFSLYVHLPFCDSICLYCGCSVMITNQRERSSAYVDQVLKEAHLLARDLTDRHDVAQHHWGGGTPTFLSPADIQRLYRGIQEQFPSLETAEVSIEVDPRVTTHEQLAALREVGFNRISLGVQDFTPEVQEAVHRVQSPEDTKDLIDEARRLGFDSVNVDLIYGLPLQRCETFEQTLSTVTDWKVDRVACYSFAHVPWLKKHQNAIAAESLPDRDTKFALLELALFHFESKDYVSIGFDHFARAEDSLSVAAREGRLHRNFMGYATRIGKGREAEDMLALGMTSIGEVAGAFAQNEHTLAAWRDAVEAGRLPVSRGLQRSADDEERRRIILDMMCNYGVTWNDYDDAAADRYAPAIEALRPLEADGLCSIDAAGIRVTDTGRIFLRNLTMPFDAYLGDQQSRGKPMFSRTV